jgi:hypothetical protein
VNFAESGGTKRYSSHTAVDYSAIAVPDFSASRLRGGCELNHSGNEPAARFVG